MEKTVCRGWGRRICEEALENQSGEQGWVLELSRTFCLDSSVPINL